MSRIGSVKPSGALSSVASADSDRWVLAMQIGMLLSPSRLNCSIFCSASA